MAHTSTEADIERSPRDFANWCTNRHEDVATQTFVCETTSMTVYVPLSGFTLFGRYEFTQRTEPIDMEEIIRELTQEPVRDEGLV